MLAVLGVKGRCVAESAFYEIIALRQLAKLSSG